MQSFGSEKAKKKKKREIEAGKRRSKESIEAENDSDLFTNFENSNFRKSKTLKAIKEFRRDLNSKTAFELNSKTKFESAI